MTYVDEPRTETETMNRTGAYPMHDRNAPFFGPRDVIAGALVCAMIWGPLLAGAVLHR